MWIATLHFSSTKALSQVLNQDQLVVGAENVSLPELSSSPHTSPLDASINITFRQIHDMVLLFQCRLCSFIIVSLSRLSGLLLLLPDLDVLPRSNFLHSWLKLADLTACSGFFPLRSNSHHLCHSYIWIEILLPQVAPVLYLLSLDSTNGLCIRCQLLHETPMLLYIFTDTRCSSFGISKAGFGGWIWGLQRGEFGSEGEWRVCSMLLVGKGVVQHSSISSASQHVRYLYRCTKRSRYQRVL